MLFNFLETPPFSMNFEWFGISDQNFIYNSGSYFIFVALIVLSFTGRELISRVMILCRRQEWARKLGVATSNEAYYFGMKQALQKLFIESYFEILLAVSVGLMAFRLHPISEFMQTRDDKLCTCVTLAFALLCIYMPLRAFYVVRNELGSLQNPRQILKIGVFFEDLKTNN